MSSATGYGPSPIAHRPSPVEDRLVIVRVGTRRLAVPLSDVTAYAPAAAACAVEGAPPWVGGALGDGARGTWRPVVRLAALWGDPSLDGPSTHLVVAGGLALAVGGYTRTREAAPIVPLRPAPANAALRRAAIVDGRALPVLDVGRLAISRRLTADGYPGITT